MNAEVVQSFIDDCNNCEQKITLKMQLQGFKNAYVKWELFERDPNPPASNIDICQNGISYAKSNIDEDGLIDDAFSSFTIDLSQYLKNYDYGKSTPDNGYSNSGVYQLNLDQLFRIEFTLCYEGDECQVVEESIDSFECPPVSETCIPNPEFTFSFSGCILCEADIITDTYTGYEICNLPHPIFFNFYLLRPNNYEICTIIKFDNFPNQITETPITAASSLYQMYVDMALYPTATAIEVILKDADGAIVDFIEYNVVCCKDCQPVYYINDCGGIDVFYITDIKQRTGTVKKTYGCEIDGCKTTQTIIKSTVSQQYQAKIKHQDSKEFEELLVKIHEAKCFYLFDGIDFHQIVPNSENFSINDSSTFFTYTK